ncbi:MAG: 1-aminocyclopropane-1-carboxylate deaminase [Flavobacteriales bacterium]|jgi:1-aminocyclopropane-1-carboxylate deaminase
MHFNQTIVSKLSPITDEITKEAGVSLELLREDEIHPVVSGNKFRKIKYNILQVLELGLAGIITYGGPHSNHIAATAVACQMAGVKCRGFIRKGFGGLTTTPTLKTALAAGMLIEMLENDTFASKKKDTMIDEESYLYIPEGGANELGVKGCEEIITAIPPKTNVVMISCGTGSTLAGVLKASKESQHIIGVNVLKAPGMIEKEVIKWTAKENYHILDQYHFGGYAKANDELITFITWFYQTHGIMLDMVYTGKMMFALYQEMKMGTIRDKKVVAIHTGGLQGNEAMEKRYGVELFK